IVVTGRLVGEVGKTRRIAADIALLADADEGLSARERLIGAGQAAVPQLLAALGHHDPELRANVAATLCGLAGFLSPEDVPQVVAALRESNWVTQTNLLWVLNRMRGRAAAAVPAVEALTADPNDTVARLARMTVASIRGDAVGEPTRETDSPWS